MKDWIKKLNDILVINEREILESPGQKTKQEADEKAYKEFEKFKQLEAKEELKQLDELENEMKRLKPGNIEKTKKKK